MFMKPQITRKEDWWKVETQDGTMFYPCQIMSRGQAEGAWILEEETERVIGYGYRLSAPGYMDCTEWSVVDSPEEAISDLDVTYGDDSEEWAEAIEDLRKAIADND